MKDGNDTRSVIIFCSATHCPQQTGGRPDLSRHHRRLQENVCLGPHRKGLRCFWHPTPKCMAWRTKRAKTAGGGPNPFVDPGAFNTTSPGLEKTFDEGLAKQTAEAQANK